MFAIGILTGCLLFFLVLSVVNKASNRRKIEIKESRDKNSGSPIFIEAATIADDLVPLLTPHVSEGAEIMILGSDGHYARSTNAKKLLTGLRDWIEKGAQVRYLLLEPNDSVDDDGFRVLLEDYPNNFNISHINRAACRDVPNVEFLLEKYKTRHPTLLINGDRSAMWVEGYHQPQSVFAYNVKFVSPKALTDLDERKEFNTYKEDFERLVDHCNIAPTKSEQKSSFGLLSVPRDFNDRKTRVLLPKTA
ncbi:hypothetical protein [Rhodobium gokarnense]|uniref:Uncharacterized protein n=1 Tax=Rhodobium gokarnense TaxID=364296 RepID=A0ABT3H750_9HYPH|nr:hypothetical protein [Rhodobium gokarnense]MCW2306220.1 hypothetical protein [Rhodobium gokarnense]